MKIYLAGHVPKGKTEEKDFVNWRVTYQEELIKHFPAEIIDPFSRDLDETNLFEVFGKDCQHIKNCDLVVVNAETQLGVGTSQEMLVAKYFKKPVVVVLPKDTYHRRSNITINEKYIPDWIHPFIFSVADFIIENIAELGQIKDQLVNTPIKDISIIDDSISQLGQKSQPGELR